MSKLKNKVDVFMVFFIFGLLGKFFIGNIGFFIAIIIGLLYLILKEITKITSYLENKN